MKAPLHIALLAVLVAFLLGEFHEPLFLFEVAYWSALLLAIASLATAASHGWPATQSAWRTLLRGTAPRPAPTALALMARLVRDLALALAALAATLPLLMLAADRVPPPAELAALIRMALLLGVLGLVVGEMWIARAARDLAARCELPVDRPGLAPLTFLVLPTLVLFAVFYQL